MKKPRWSMILFFQSMPEYVQSPEKKHNEQKKYGSFATRGGEVVKCSV